MNKFLSNWILALYNNNYNNDIMAIIIILCIMLQLPLLHNIILWRVLAIVHQWCHNDPINIRHLNVLFM